MCPDNLKKWSKNVPRVIWISYKCTIWRIFGLWLVIGIGISCFIRKVFATKNLLSGFRKVFVFFWLWKCQILVTLFKILNLLAIDTVQFWQSASTGRRKHSDHDDHSPSLQSTGMIPWYIRLVYIYFKEFGSLSLRPPYPPKKNTKSYFGVFWASNAIHIQYYWNLIHKSKLCKFETSVTWTFVFSASLALTLLLAFIIHYSSSRSPRFSVAAGAPISPYCYFAINWSWGTFLKMLLNHTESIMAKSNLLHFFKPDLVFCSILLFLLNYLFTPISSNATG